MNRDQENLKNWTEIKEIKEKHNGENQSNR